MTWRTVHVALRVLEIFRRAALALVGACALTIVLAAQAYLTDESFMLFVVQVFVTILVIWFEILMVRYVTERIFKPVPVVLPAGRHFAQ